jgi:hypothetical protein
MTVATSTAAATTVEAEAGTTAAPTTTTTRRGETITAARDVAPIHLRRPRRKRALTAITRGSRRNPRRRRSICQPRDLKTLSRARSKRRVRI